ncbi:MAG: hypothetical protein ACLQFR_01400 [Streptosporangiaceae bacterium]
MNSGGEPERDDTGLPPVDIEIPDDARELDRDVQAYYREQRALRRQQRRSRWHGVLAKDGIVLPLLACCLILALITGTLLTVFTAASDRGFSRLPGTWPGGSADNASGPSGTAQSGAEAARTAAGPARQISLPDTTVLVGARPVRLRKLTSALLVLIPKNCTCTAAVAGLAQFAAAENAQAYLVSSSSNNPDVSRLAGQVSQPNAGITVAVDSGNALRQYQDGVTAILVGPDHDAAVASNLGAGENLSRLRPALPHTN